MHLPDPLVRLWRTGSRWTTRLFGSAPIFLTVVLIGICTGTLIFAMTYTPAPTAPPTGPDSGNVETEKVESARTSLQEAQLLFGFLSGAATSASSGISTVTSSAQQIFDSIDTARLGADQLVQALGSAPDLTVAADQIATASTSAGNAVGEAQNLSAVATQFDQLISPLLTTLDTVKAPGSKETRDSLQAMQTSARALSADLESVAGLRTSLTDLGSSVQTSAASANSAISSAYTSAVELRDGLATLADARTDAVAAAEQVTDGVDQLGGVLTSIGDDLKRATESLTVEEPEAPAGDETRAAEPQQPGPATEASAVTTAKAIGYGALASLVVLFVIAGFTGSARRPGKVTAT